MIDLSALYSKRMEEAIEELGDTVSAINKFDYSKNISYVSTSGGAFLEYLEGLGYKVHK